MACRSREGAWIEMYLCYFVKSLSICRSREGAWIEIRWNAIHAPAVCRRSREGAWIEINVGTQGITYGEGSLPRGSVD